MDSEGDRCKSENDNVFTDSSLDGESDNEEVIGVQHGRYTKFHHGSSSSDNESTSPIQIQAQVHTPPYHGCQTAVAQVKN